MRSPSGNERKTGITNEPLITAKEVAAILNVSPSWVYQNSAAGVLPCRKLGGNLRFVPEEIREWINSQK